MSTGQPGGEAAARVFIDKMIAFRASLLTDEQRMLDELVDAGIRPRQDDLVRPYWVTPGSDADLWAPYRAVATDTGPQSRSQ